MTLHLQSLVATVRTLLRAYVEWQAHVQIAVAAALAVPITVVPCVDLSVRGIHLTWFLPCTGVAAVRLYALPITGALIITGYWVVDEYSSLWAYLADLHGLKQVSVASLPALSLVFTTEVTLVRLLQLSYATLGFVVVAVACLYLSATTVNE